MFSLSPYPITPIGNFIGIILAILPLLSNIRKLSLAVWGYATWIAIYDLTMFVDTIIWHNNVDYVNPIWCNIVEKLQFGAGVGTRACIFVICIHLYKVTRLHGSVGNIISKKEKRKTMLYELAFIVGLPSIMMALFTIVQPFHFQVLEELGCDPTMYGYEGYILKYAPLLISNVGCAILAPLTLRTFLRHRNEMKEYFSNGGEMTRKKYFRLMVIACIDTLFNLPVTVICLATDIAGGKEDPLNNSYISWTNAHDGGSFFSSVVPAQALSVTTPHLRTSTTPTVEPQPLPSSDSILLTPILTLPIISTSPLSHSLFTIAVSPMPTSAILLSSPIMPTPAPASTSTVMPMPIAGPTSAVPTSAVPLVPVWSSDIRDVFIVKWDEWIYVLQAVVFFCIFGTTPEMRNYFRCAFWFIPKRLGFKKRRVSRAETGTISDIAFNSAPGQQTEDDLTASRGPQNLSLLGSTVNSETAAHLRGGVEP